MIVDVALSRDSKTGKYTGLWQPQLKHKLIKMSHSKPLFNFFSVFFKQTIQLLQLINVKNVHPVYSAGIRSQDRYRTSLLP